MTIAYKGTWILHWGGRHCTRDLDVTLKPRPATCDKDDEDECWTIVKVKVLDNRPILTWTSRGQNNNHPALRTFRNEFILCFRSRFLIDCA